MTKKHFYYIIFFLILVLPLAGCDWLMEVYGIRKRRPQADQEEISQELVPEVQSTELAKLIIRPKPKILKVQRDPFKPLITKERKTTLNGQEIPDDTFLTDVHFLGVVKFGEHYSALLRTSEAKGAFNVGEKVGTYVLTDIKEDYIVFTKGEKTYKIKRGEDNENL